jgi:hypothetical protein
MPAVDSRVPAGYPVGLYVCRLEAGGAIATRNLVVLK